MFYSLFMVILGRDIIIGLKSSLYVKNSFLTLNLPLHGSFKPIQADLL